MNSKRAFEIELELYEECREYIERGCEPKDEIMETCYQAYAAVQAYRMALENKEVRRDGTHTDSK